MNLKASSTFVSSLQQIPYYWDLLQYMLWYHSHPSTARSLVISFPSRTSIHLWIVWRFCFSSATVRTWNWSQPSVSSLNQRPYFTRPPSPPIQGCPIAAFRTNWNAGGPYGNAWRPSSFLTPAHWDRANDRPPPRLKASPGPSLCVRD